MSKQPTGIGFVGCDLQRSSADDGAHNHDAPAHHTHRQEVSINGTRITTVDIHAHCTVPEARAILGSQPTEGMADLRWALLNSNEFRFLP